MNFREHFEAWHKKQYGYIGKMAHHSTALNTFYQTTACQQRWEAWQACADWAVVLSTAQLGGWIACADRLPVIRDDSVVSDDVLGGCWITDNWLRDDHPKKRRFVFGACSVRRTDDLLEFPQGKQWHTFDPSHNQITHWCEVVLPNAALRDGEAVPLESTVMQQETK